MTFPSLGAIAIKEIKSSDVLATLKPLIGKKQLSTAQGYTVKLAPYSLMSLSTTLPITPPRNQ